MKRLRLVSRLLSWALFGMLIGLGFWQGAGASQPGGWLWSMLAGLVLAGLVFPQWLLRALPAAAMATFAGGLMFSFLPQLQGQNTAIAMMLGAGGAAVLAAVLCLEGRGAIGTAILAGGGHIGLIQVLTAPVMTSPFALWPWSAAALLAVWLCLGAAIGVTARWVT